MEEKYKNLLVEEMNNGIYFVTINREEKFNALNIQIISDLEHFFSFFNKDKKARGCVISGAGEKSFVSGADISEIKTLQPEQAKIYSSRGQELFLAIEKSPKPIVALVNGFALGGGCELAMACHFRIATPNAKFSLPEINLGIIPGFGGTVRLPKMIGKTKALEMMLTGKMISSEEALNFGLVSYILEFTTAKEKALSLLENISAKSPLVVEKILQLYSSESNIDDLNKEAELFSACFYTKDAQEGMDAFLNKRSPHFKGE